mgnify:CR=1 FL=1
MRCYVLNRLSVDEEGVGRAKMSLMNWPGVGAGSLKRPPPV